MLEIQIENEIQHSIKHVKKKIWNSLLQDLITCRLAIKGIALLQDSGIKGLSKRIPLDVFTEVISTGGKELLTSLAGKLSYLIDNNNKVESIRTMCRVIMILSEVNFYDVEITEDGIYVYSRYKLSSKLKEELDSTMYPLPMVSKPKELNSPYDSAQHELKGTVMLGMVTTKIEVPVDVLNVQNSIPLTLNTQFIGTTEELPNKPIQNIQANLQYAQFTRESKFVYKKLFSQGNLFYLTNKYDKRGRMYAQGYHVNTQGMAYKKAIIELHNKETVTGA